MDENYLDQLLKNVENQDNMMDGFDDLSDASMDLGSEDDSQIEEALSADASSVRDVAWSDAEIPVNEISELDELDDLADMDMEDLDFEDIDFDEINNTASTNPVQLEQELADLMNLKIDESYLNDIANSDFEEEFKRMKAANGEPVFEDNDFVDTLNDPTATVADTTADLSPDLTADLTDAFGQTEENDPALNELEAFVNEGADIPADLSDGLPEDLTADLSEDLTGGMPEDLTAGLSEEMMGDTQDTAPQEDLTAAFDNTTASSDAEMDIDALMSEVFGDDSAAGGGDSGAAEIPTDFDAIQDIGASDTASEATVAEQSGSDAGSSEMDDLFAMLGIDSDTAMMGAVPDTSQDVPDFEIPPELADVPDINEKPKKQNKFLQLLFGSDDDDEETLTPEQEEALAQEKEAKKQAKLEKKEAKKQEKAEKDAQKKKTKEEKTAQLQAKKEAKKAEEARLLAEEGPEKQLNKPLVIITILFFLAIGGFVIIGTNIFDYTLVISRAQNYFERQKYGAAYREIVGVEVKEKDKDLESRIYTVMYVERQNEAFNNYVKLNRPDLALDALLSGLEKYDLYYNEAVELQIVDDLTYSKNTIVATLYDEYGLTEEQAKEILQQNPFEYTQTIRKLTQDMDWEADEAE